MVNNYLIPTLILASIFCILCQGDSASSYENKFNCKNHKLYDKNSNFLKICIDRKFSAYNSYSDSDGVNTIIIENIPFEKIHSPNKSKFFRRTILYINKKHILYPHFTDKNGNFIGKDWRSHRIFKKLLTKKWITGVLYYHIRENNSNMLMKCSDIDVKFTKSYCYIESIHKKIRYTIVFHKKFVSDWKYILIKTEDLISLFIRNSKTGNSN